MTHELYDSPEIKPNDSATSDAPKSTLEKPANAPVIQSGPGESALPFYVVGLGASAGGLEALERFFGELPGDTGLAFVVVQHLSPDHKSMMAELLSRHTAMTVRAAGDGVQVVPNCVYLIPPRKNIIFADGHLRLIDKDPHFGVNLPIDIFFRSLAEQQGERSVGIVLSGTGSDGMHGIRAIKEAGGIVMVQDTSSAKFDGMPRSAASTGVADFVLPPDQMPEQLLRCVRAVPSVDGPRQDAAVRATGDEYSEIIGLLRREADVDFTHYKPSTILRRIERRMTVNHLTELGDYVALARQSPSEIKTLFKDLLIGVTKFFRDTEVFDRLREKVIGPLVERARENEPLRIWVPGCATGEEAYSVAMLLVEEMAAQGRTLEFKIFATDIDRDSLEFASAATYSASIVADVSPERLSKFFQMHGDGFVLSRRIRQSVLFAYQNVLKDPPFTKLDIISCRNMLIYLNSIIQRHVLSVFHFALKPGGTLILGLSESIGEFVDHFRTTDSRLKFFESFGAPRLPIGSAALSAADKPVRALVGEGPRGLAEARAIERVALALIREFAPTSIIIDEYYQLVHVFGDVSAYLQIASGGASLNVLKMTRRPFSALLASAVPRAMRHGKESVYTGVEFPDDAASVYVDVRVRPLEETPKSPRLLLVIFEQSEQETKGASPVEVVSLGAHAEQQLAELQRELQHSKENLQAMVEELETSNEELQAANEELLAANEELQSTNEELQSVNEELHTVNTEYEQKITELTDLNNDMDNLLQSTEIGTLFLDEQLNVRKFTPAVTTYISMLERDVGRPVEHLAFHLGGDEFMADLRQVVETSNPSERSMTTRDGKRVLVRIRPYTVPSATRPGGAVITFVDITTVKRADERTQRVLDSLPQRIAMLDSSGIILSVNTAWKNFAQRHGKLQPAGVGANYLDVCRADAEAGDDSTRSIRDGILRVLRGELLEFVTEYASYPGHDDSWWFVVRVVPVGSGEGAVVAYTDITKKKVAELALAEHRRLKAD